MLWQAEQGRNASFGQRSLKEKIPRVGAGGDTCLGVPLTSLGLLLPEAGPRTSFSLCVFVEGARHMIDEWLP